MSILDLSLAAYFITFSFFFGLLLPQVRRALRKEPWYDKSLNYFLLTRQILFFLFPLWAAAIIVGLNGVLNQLLTLVALGLSITIFWVIEFPLLMKPDILVTFGVDEGNAQGDAIPEGKFIEKLVLSSEKDNIVNTRIRNMGFSTLKNSRIAIYFGDGFEAASHEDL